MLEKQKNLQEPERKAQSLPPEEHSADLEENRVDAVDERSGHVWLSSCSVAGLLPALLLISVA